MTENLNSAAVRHVHLRILAVDDTPANLVLLEAVLSNAGHSVILAKSGEEAILSYQAARPDLVLMDVMMPGMDGIETTRRIRKLDTTHWVPIIFISALSHRDDMVRGLEAGGDDYLGKPVDILLLLAKINAMQRISALEEKLRKSNALLDAYRHNSERELDMARELLEHMVKGASTALPGVELWLQPAANLGGDLLITQKCSSGVEYLLLADAMGHGLSAAMPLVPLVQVFSGMTRVYKPVHEIVREMNMKLSRLLPVGNFVAVTLISLDRANRKLEIWNGGNPPVLLADRNGNAISRLSPRHVSLGILQDDSFDDSTESFRWSDKSYLVLYSDGLADAVNARGKQFGEEGIISALQCCRSHQCLKVAIAAHLGGQGTTDDISVATVLLN